VIAFQVNDMTCGHCVSQITKAVKAADTGAAIEFDLATHQVRIEPVLASASALSAAITAAGYTPVVSQDVANPRRSSAAPARKGCCCG